jgi:hypothetical protein
VKVIMHSCKLKKAGKFFIISASFNVYSAVELIVGQIRVQATEMRKNLMICWFI